MKRRIKCDACSRPLRLGSAGETIHLTDDRVCGSGDGPGFFLCDRRPCQITCEKAEAAGGLERLRALYADGRRKNERKRGRPKTGKSKDTVLVAFRVSKEVHAHLLHAAKLTGKRSANALAKALVETPSLKNCLTSIGRRVDSGVDNS